MKRDTSVTQTGSRERGRSAQRRITVIKPPGKNCIAGFKSSTFTEVCRVRGTVPGLKDQKHLRNRSKNPQRRKSCLCVNMLLLSFHSMNICKEQRILLTASQTPPPPHGISDSSSSSGDVGEVGVSSPSAATVAAGDAAAAVVGVIFS